MVENLFRGHPTGVHPWHRNPFFIREIREIRGSTAVLAGFNEFNLAPPCPPSEPARSTWLGKLMAAQQGRVLLAAEPVAPQACRPQ